MWKGVLTMNVDDIFCNNFNMYLEKKGVTQRELAEAINVSYAAVSKWSVGKSVPRMDKVDLICDYLHVSRSDLLEHKNDDDSIDYTLARRIAALPANEKKVIEDIVDILLSKGGINEDREAR